MTSTPGAQAANGFGRVVFRFLGSIKLAMLLLAVLILACIIGTIAESRFDTAVAQAYFYDAPWFLAWLILLCVNLTAAVLVRYPWKPHQTGFVITHAGIVILLIGAMIGRIWGVEGFVTLHAQRDPVRYLQLNRTALHARSTQTPEGKSKNISLKIRPPTRARPINLTLNDASISVIGVAQELGSRTIVDQGETSGPPALRLTLRSGMVAEPIATWLVLGDKARDRFSFGPATIRFLAEHDKVEEQTPVSAPLLNESSGEMELAPEPKQRSRERHFAFAKMPEMSMARAVEGGPSGAKVSYRFDASDAQALEGKGILEIQVAGQQFRFLVTQLADRRTPLTGTPWTLEQVKYLADFRIEGKEAVSVSDEPNNPAVLFELTGETSAAASSAASECDHAAGECDHAEGSAHAAGHGCCKKEGAPGHSHGSSATSQLTIYYGSGGTLRYATVSKGSKTAEGPVEVGKEISIGLADWKIEPTELIERARIREELAPVSAEAPQAVAGEGVLVRVSRGTEQREQWIASGIPAHVKLGDATIHLSFGYETHPLDFAVALERFEVERDEGTQNPAGYKSRVRFIDPKRRAAPLEREIWMNHPANYPDFPGAGWLGTAYKFSQASWNPNDLQQTTLQVLRDPGWSLKWIGSLLLCAGLFTMFYLKPYPRFTQGRKP